MLERLKRRGKFMQGLRGGDLAMAAQRPTAAPARSVRCTTAASSGNRYPDRPDPFRDGACLTNPDALSSPDRPPAAGPIDRDALRQKYRQERDKRLRQDGNAQYLPLAGALAGASTDPYLPVQARPPCTDELLFTFIGGGFSGLLTGARLKEAGLADVRIVEKAGDFGGTWYWNRYPGAQCDTASMVYMPLLEETGHRPSEKYAHGPELLEHSRRIGRQYGLYDKALFHTQVTALQWVDDRAAWRVRTDRGDDFFSRHVGLGTGPLHVPKLPGIPGIERFQGHAFHTSRWDYAYTGGDAAGAPMTGLAGKRVAIIGTGATAVQCVPHLARACGQLFVFQRTPSSVDVRANAPIDAEWFAALASPGWQQRWLDNFTANAAGGAASEDLVQDGWTDLSRRIRSRIAHLPREQMTPQAMWAAFEAADDEKMNQIRARVDAIVQDGATAQHLKAWYRQLCKRPCFHDEYLQAFNSPNTTLVDTDGQGVERITEQGVVAGGVEYPVDCIIYASGFEVGTPFERRAGFDVLGRGGHALSAHWAEGMRSLHGMHVHGFPNLYIVQPTQGANLISNVPHNFSESARSIAAILAHAQAQGARTVEVTPAAEEAWIKLLLSGPGRMIGSQDCTPGYYNNEGQDPGMRGRLAVGHPGGPGAFFRYIDEWRRSGRFEGLAFGR
jgi:cyclohexanone monooxygenase